MSTILYIMESSGLDRKEWPCLYVSPVWASAKSGVVLQDDEAEALFAHDLDAAIRELVGEPCGIEVRENPIGNGDWFAHCQPLDKVAWTRSASGYTRLAALGALHRAVKGD